MKNTYDELLAQEREAAKIAACRTYRTFDAYAQENPEGEHFRRWITNDGHLAPDALLIFSGEGTHSGIPGGFLWARLARHYVRVERNKVEPTDKWYIHVHDCDDGLLVNEYPDKDAALNALTEIEGYAPISFHDLHEILGFKWEN